MRSQGLLLSVLVVGAVGGCDWRDFDKIQAHTPVLAAGAPSGFGETGDFGRNLLALSGPAASETGGRFIGSAAGGAAVGIVALDAQGNAHGQSVSSAVFDTGEINGQSLPVTALAEVPGTNLVLLGAPLAGDTGSVYLMTLGASPDVMLLAAPAGADRFGLGVGAGQLAGTAAADFVVVSGSDLTVFLDGDPSKPVVAAPPPDTCPLGVSMDLAESARNSRAVLVAQLTGVGSSQIVVGTPSKSDAGAVSVFTVDATGNATCAFTYRNPAGLFGRALATGDFNNDKIPDLLIGAPPNAAFWIQGPLTATSAILPVTLAGAGGGQRGASVAALDADGQPGDEAIVGDPGAAFGGNLLAGEVHIVGGAALDHELPTLHAHEADGELAFGAQVSALPFCMSGCGTASATTRNLLLVGSQAHAFTYFVLESGVPDPRKP